MPAYANNFEGGTSGTTVSTANSGGGSGTPFNTVNIPATHTNTYINTPAIVGGLSGKITPGGTGGTSYYEWGSTTLGTIGPNIYTRCYFMWPTIPNGSLNVRIQKLWIGGLGVAGVVIWGSAATGKFTWADSADSAGTNSSTVLQANIVYRFEAAFTLSATVGQITINLYAGHSTTALETLSSSANLNLRGTTADTASYGFVGINADSTNFGPLYLDGLGLSTTGAMGPLTPPTAPVTIPTIPGGMAGGW